ncbi:MAG TPA: hypothetical protein VHW03_02440 [Chthoniobacterales bacterium]|jgi:hypothetical protein|nr:hypothetical protein [Chthoniobacterales bacterium]
MNYFRAVLYLFVAAALAGGLWLATVPAARARTLTPAEMIQENLPPGKTMKAATKPEFLSAVCEAVRRHRDAAGAITKVAVKAHHEYAGDIVATVLRCSPNVDCDFVGRVVREAVLAYPAAASEIDDAAVAIAPDCAGAIENASIHYDKDIPAEGPGTFGVGAPSNQLPPPGSAEGGNGGGGYDPTQHRILVCDNGTQRQVNENNLAAFLRAHPGSFIGTCQPTPTTNR